MNASAQGRLAWITGGSAGIGFAIAQALAAAGFQLVLSARHEAELQAACNELQRAGARADYVVLDVTRRNEVESACRTIQERHGRIDVLVNNAGFNVRARKWDELNADEFDAVLAANLSGTFYAINAVLPAMRAQGGGVIINMSSTAGRRVSLEGGVAYSAAKHGVAVLTESLNMAEAKNGVRACIIEPAGVNTRAHSWRSQEIRDAMLKPEDVARAVRFAVETPPGVAIQEIVISSAKR